MPRVTRGRLGWEWVPIAVVGAAAASVGELAAGLLLYASQGFLRALTLVLATELGALGLGLRIASASLDPVESVRRRWLFILVAFTGAAVFSGAWTLLDGFSAAPFSQGLGLAVLAGLPLYAVGGLLAVLEGGRGSTPPPGGSKGGRLPVSRVGAAAVLGAAAGILLTGLVLVPRLQAPSVLLLWLVLLSGAALLHGWILDGQTVMRVLETLPSPYGPVEVQLWQRGAARAEYRILGENGRVRGGEDGGGRPVRAWEEGAAILAHRREPPDPGTSGRFLLLGGGTGTLARLLRGMEPEGRIVVVERNPEVSRAARRHLSEEGTPEVELLHGDPVELVGGIAGPFDLVFLDGAGVTPGDPVPLVAPDVLQILRSRLAPRGALVMAPLPGVEDGDASPVRAILSRAVDVFPEVILYRSSEGGGGAGVAGEDHGFLLLPRDAGGEWPERLGVLGASRPSGRPSGPPADEVAGGDPAGMEVTPELPEEGP